MPKHKLTLSVQYADDRLKDSITRPLLRRWVQAALFAPAELTLRFVGSEEGRDLNRDYRGKDYATNVLTFAYTEDEDSEVTEADIIFCTDVLEKEAAEQKKSVEEHTAHLVVHGVLHAQEKRKKRKRKKKRGEKQEKKGEKRRVKERADKQKEGE